jgi:hypothetical protein
MPDGDSVIGTQRTQDMSPVAHKPSLERMGVSTQGAINVGGFTGGQKRRLDFRRNFVFLESGLGKARTVNS